MHHVSRLQPPARLREYPAPHECRASRRLLAVLLVVTAASALAQSYTEVSIEITGADGTLDQVAYAPAGTWVSSGEDDQVSAIASVTAAGMRLSTTGAANNSGFEGRVALINATVSDQLSIHSGMASGTGYAVLRFDVGEVSATNGVSLSLGLRGGADMVHLSEYPLFDEHFSVGLVEFAHAFTFSDTPDFDPINNFVASVSLGVQAFFDPFRGLSTQSWDFSQGATFLGIAGVYDAGYNPVTDYTVSSMSGANYQISAIPEPSTYAAIVGFGALGIALLRRRAPCPKGSHASRRNSGCSPLPGWGAAPRERSDPDR